MNERIKEFAEQAGMTQYVAAENKYLEKFAELIIRECISVVRDINQEYDDSSTVVNAADEIRDYFRVK